MIIITGALSKKNQEAVPPTPPFLMHKSFFMNPIVPRKQYEELRKRYPEIPHYEVDADRVKIPAAWMIDQCGWKGKKIGRAGVHDKQALVLVNCGGATGQEVITLSEEIQKSVKERFGIQIFPEVNFI